MRAFEGETRSESLKIRGFFGLSIGEGLKMKCVLRPFLGIFNTVRNVVKYRSEVVIDTFGTSLNTASSTVEYPSGWYEIPLGTS